MDQNARVQFFPLLKRQEGEEYMVGRPEINAFIFLPAEGVALIELLEQGKTLAEAAQAFHERFGETPDVVEFVETLAAEQFVQSSSTGDLPQATAATVQATPAAGHFSGIPQQMAAKFFVRPLLWLYGVYIAGAVALVILQPQYVPRSIDQLWHPLVMVSSLGMIAGSFSFAFMHEFFHLLATRAKGVPARLGISRRMLTLVAVTDISGLYAVEPKERFLPYMAGMLWDALAGSTFIYVLALSDAGIFSLAGVGYALCKAGVILCTMRLVWQVQVHLKSDVYFVVANWLRTRNLQADSIGYLRNLWDRMRGRIPQYDLSAIPSRERMLVQRYAILLVGLLGFYWVSFVYLQLPFLLKTVPAAARHVLAGWSENPAAFGDSILYLAMLGFNYGMLLWVTVRDRRQQRSQHVEQGVAQVGA